MVTRIDLSELDEEIKGEVKDYIINVANKLVNEAKKNAPVASGHLRQDIDIIEREDNTITVGTNLKYASFVEFGTDPHYPPIEPLKKWVRRKLGVEEDVAYAVQQKIGQEGTEPQPYMRDAIESTRRYYQNK